MVSGMEVSSWVGRDLRIGWCVVWCVGEKERRRGKERRKKRRRGKERRKKRGNESISLYYSPSTPLRGLHPAGIHSPNTLLHTITQPLSIEPRPKNGGSPPPPHQGKGRKKRRKRALTIHTILNFSLWGRTPRPPLLTGTRKKKTRKARARVNLTSRTKSIDLNETS